MPILKTKNSCWYK